MLWEQLRTSWEIVSLTQKKKIQTNKLEKKKLKITYSINDEQKNCIKHKEMDRSLFLSLEIEKERRAFRIRRRRRNRG